MGKRARGDDNVGDDESHSPAPDDVTQRDVPCEPRGSSNNSSIIEPRPTKYAELDETAEIKDNSQTVMLCTLPPHRDSLTFPHYDAYEVHYAKEHVNRCVECGRNFPTGHYLGLHIAENHDPLNEARKARGDKIYGCFVEGCDRMCSAPQKRRRHLIDKHLFPREFNFYVVDDGIDKRRSMLRPAGHRRRSSVTINPTQREQASRRRRATVETSQDQGQQPPRPDGQPGLADHPGRIRGDDAAGSRDDAQGQSVPSAAADHDMSELIGSMSALRFVPPSVRFGRGQRAGLSSR
ncbi:MAG: hypothetical protein M1815_006328 [Lichina confinis]|nr:MAG: hypothetical protein M1815_006328 [Lichina confinis]